MIWRNTLQYKKIFLPSRKLHFASFFWSFRLDVAKGLVTPGGWHLNCVTFITCEQDLRAHCIVFRLMGGCLRRNLHKQVWRRSDIRYVLANCPRACLLIVLLLAYYHIPDAILFKFSSFLRNSNCVQRTDGRTDKRMDGPMDRRTDIPSNRDARMHLKSPFSLILTCVMDIRIDGRTDGPTDRRTDVQSHPIIEMWECI